MRDRPTADRIESRAADFAELLAEWCDLQTLVDDPETASAYGDKRGRYYVLGPGLLRTPAPGEVVSPPA
jgi:hypothetical protein